MAKVRSILKEKPGEKSGSHASGEQRAVPQLHGEHPDVRLHQGQTLQHIYQNRKVDSLITRMDRSDVSARSLFDPETADRLEAADRQILSGEKETLELVFSTPVQGKAVWLKDLKFRINISETEHAVGGVVFDITEIKEYEAELEEHKHHLEELVAKRTKDLKTANQELESTLQALRGAQARLVQSEKMASLGVLTAAVSHEINNPLQYLSGIHYGFANYFKTHGSRDEETTNLLLQSTETSIERISGIVSGLNQFSRDNSDYDEDCDIHSILDNCLVMLHHETKHRIEVTRHFSGESLVVKGNVGKLHQVFMNVLINAIQSIDSEGRMDITTSVKKGRASILVSDTGSGIPREHLSKILDPFFTTKEPGKGTGLGLSITFSILKEHHGHIEFESEPNQGTKAMITLPLKKKS
ncbi:MAG: ATP-binding protein [Bacteroidales bacterium]